MIRGILGFAQRPGKVPIERLASEPIAIVRASLSLPPIPAQDVMLYSALGDRSSRAALRTLTLAFR